MRRYPGNFTDSELLTVPRNLKVRPDHDTTHLAYITDKEADLLQKNKPGTPHKGPQGIPNYDGGDILTYTPSGMSGTGYQGPSQQQQQQQQQHDQQVQQNIGDTYKSPSQVYGSGPLPQDIIYDDKIADYSFSTPDVKSSVKDRLKFRDRTGSEII